MKKWLLLLLIVACAPIDVSDAPQFKTVPYGDMPEQVMDIYKVGDTVQPAIIIVHGSAWEGGTGRKENMRGEAKVFVEAGYTAVVPEYRMMGDHAYPDSQSDIACVAATVYAQADKLRIDKDNIIIMGYSAGTYTTSQVAYNFDDMLLEDCKYKTVQLKGYIGMSGIGYYSVKNIQEMFNQTVNRDYYNGLNIVESAYDLVNSNDIPAYFLVGSEDESAPADIVRAMHDRCVERGLETEFTLIDGVGHGNVLGDEVAKETILRYASKIIE